MRVRPLHANILVRRWQNPVEPDGMHIVLPESYAGDRTGTLWEVVAAGPCVEHPCAYCKLREKELEEIAERTQGEGSYRPFRGVGMALLPDDLLTMRFGWTAVSLEGQLGEDLWVLHARNIAAVERWKNATVE